MTTFVVLEGDEWGMRWADPPRSERLLDPETYIHHRAGNPRHDWDAAAAFREMNEQAIAGGMSATHYDILVHENTITDTVTIGVARGAKRSGATMDRNEEGEAVCALGYFHPGHRLSARPSPAMLEGLARAVALLVRRGWSAPNTKVLGHRDNPKQTNGSPCPGDYLYPHVPWIGRRAAELLTPEPPPEDDDMLVEYIRTPPPDLPGRPFFYVRGASVRYADGGDVAYAKANGIPIERDPDWQTEPKKAHDRYRLLHMSVMNGMEP